MTPIILRREDTNEVAAWQCSNCGTVWGPKHGKDMADRCCVCDECGKPTTDPVTGRMEWHRECGAKCEARNDQVAYDAAKKVPLAEYRGEYVSLPGYDADEQVVETVAFAGSGEPWAFGTTSEKASIDLRELVHDALQDHHENAMDWVDGAKLDAAALLVTAAVAKVETWYEDRSVVVVREVTS